MSATKRILLEFLDYLTHKVETDQCSVEEMESLRGALENDIVTYGTVEDLARFYGQKESNVRNLMSRRPIPRDSKPQRRVLYRFDWFRKVVPDSWKRQ